MQIINIYLEPGEGEQGLGILKELKIEDYNLIRSETSDLITVKHPLDKTDKIIDKFQEEFKFSNQDRRSIIVMTPDVILPKQEEKERKFQEKSARECIIEYAEQESYLDSKYLALFFFSAVVATLGLITDNVAVVVGAMIIAPAFGPIASAAVGVVVGRTDLFRRGIKLEVIGILLAICTAAFLAFVLPGVEMNESLRLRMFPTILDLFVGLAAGAAGAYVLVSGRGSSIVGVMVAAALLPVMTAIGIGLVFFNPIFILGAFLLLMVTVVSIILSMVIVFWFVGPQKEHIHLAYDYHLAQLAVKKVIRYSVVIIIILAIPLIWLTYENIIASTPESEIIKIFSQKKYENLELGGISIRGNVISVVVYNFDSADNAKLQMLYSKIRERVDPRYKIEFQVVNAMRFEY